MSSQTVRVKLFGDFRAWVGDDCSVDVRLKRARLLLAYLVLAPSGQASREELMTLLWSERGDAQARQSLRQTIAVIRRIFSTANVDLLRADPEMVTIDPTIVKSDVTAFRHLAGKDTLEALESAVALYAGDFLAHLRVGDPCAEEWIAERRGELQSSLLRCLASLMTAYRRLERHHDVERVAARILGLDPYDEDAHRGLITAHLSRGQRTLAFKQLQRCRQSLRQGLSVRPTAETENLLRRADRVQITCIESPTQCAIPTEAGQREGVLSTKLDHSVMASRAAAQLRRARVREPSLIVTPLEVLGEGPRAQLLAYGLVDDIVVHLSRFSSLFVVPPGPAVSLNLHPVDPMIVGETLGVRYVLTGSVQAIDDRVRVASMLLDAENGRVVRGEHTSPVDGLYWCARRFGTTHCCRRIQFSRHGGVRAHQLFDTHQLGAWELRALAQRRFLA